MKKLFLITLVSCLSNMANAENVVVEAGKIGINVRAIGTALSQKAVEEINVANKPFFCKTRSQGFGPYEGFGRTREEAATEALKKCSIYCSSDQRLDCDSREKSPLPSPGSPSGVDGNSSRFLEILQQKDLEIESLRSSLLEQRQQNTSCGEIQKSRTEWKQYAEALEKQNQVLVAKLRNYEGSGNFVKLAESCKFAFPNDQFYQNSCLATKATPDSVTACSEISDNHWKISCIQKQASAEKIKACLNLTDDNFYRISCLDK